MESFVPVTSPYCSICGIPFAGVGENHCCSGCMTKRPAFDIARAPFVYEGGVKELLHSFKYTPKPHLRKPLALLITNGLEKCSGEVTPDMIVPVPLHRKKIRQRGFNQAILLGEMISKDWKIRLERNVLQRIRWTEPQVNLSGDDRRKNVIGAFAIAPGISLTGNSILLIDDVFTTGSTLNECAKTLKNAGAEKVYAVTVARTV